MKIQLNWQARTSLPVFLSRTILTDLERPTSPYFCPPIACQPPCAIGTHNEKRFFDLFLYILVSVPLDELEKKSSTFITAL